MRYQVEQIAVPITGFALSGVSQAERTGQLAVVVAEPGAVRAAGIRRAAAHAGGTAGRGGAVVRLRRDDSTDVEALFNSQYSRLAGWVRRLVDDDETAHEIAAEAFSRLLSRWSRLEHPHSYLYMIATNLVRDHWRKMERERRALRAVAGETARSTRPDPGNAGQEVEMRQLIQALPRHQRDAFLLHYYAGFGVREVARMLGRPEGTVKADLFQARARLRSALRENK